MFFLTENLKKKTKILVAKIFDTFNKTSNTNGMEKNMISNKILSSFLKHTHYRYIHTATENIIAQTNGQDKRS